MLNNKARMKAEEYFIDKGLMPKREDRTEQWCLHHIDPTLRDTDFERYREWRIEDLIPMTMADHTILHNTINKERYTRVGNTLKDKYAKSPELRKKISDGMKAYIKEHGTTGHFGPHTETDETKEKKRKARSGKIICNNGSINKFFDPSSIPDGWVQGKVSK